jgi:Predicted Zn-dependent protease (DUF2268)
MRKKLFLSFLFLLTASCSFAQSNRLTKQADSLYKAKSYKEAAAAYLLAAGNSPIFLSSKELYYNAACCFALINDTSAALKYLKVAVYDQGYKNYDHLVRDNDLDILHKEKEWEEIIVKLRSGKDKLSDPRHAKLVTTDIHNFWNAFDKAQKDTSRREQIFIEEYFNKSSAGLKDYFVTKIGTTAAFTKNQAGKPEFYKAIRKNTLSIDTMKGTIYQYFEKLKSIYDEASFPDIYFLVGRWNSAGTVSDNGLLLGVDQVSKTPEIPTQELSLWEKNNFNDLQNIPVIVMHELIHFQQQKIKEDTTLLSYALIEGMADFICELVTGKNPSQRLQDYAQTRSKEIWEDFKKEMLLDRVYNWLFNGDKETKDKPADLGYYMGYEICKSYYEQATDKKAAIKEMLSIQDHKAFLEKSKYDEKISK